MLRSQLLCRVAQRRTHAAGFVAYGVLQNSARPHSFLCAGQQSRNLSFFSSAKKEESVDDAKAKELAQAKDDEEIRKLVEDDDSEFEEPAMTIFEVIDSAWDTLLDYVSPMRYLEKFARSLHDSLGLEWWAALCIISLAMRLVVLPIQLTSTRNTLRMSKFQTEIGMIKQSQQTALANKTLTEKERALVKNSYQQQLDALGKQGGFAEWKNYLGFVVVVPFGLVFYTVRSLVMSEPSMATGGVLWFHDLSAPDPTATLSFVAFIFICLGTEMTQSQTVPVKSPYFALQRWGGRVIAGFGMYMISGQPSGVVLGMLISSVMGIIPPLLLRSASFREWAKIPAVRGSPRSNINVEPTGMNKFFGKMRSWMQGATIDNTALGGGIGKIAHAPSEAVKNITEFKKAGGRKRVSDIKQT
ncbi:Mitochondrial inner membrane protein OXA1 [Diplonema papillatum]|nr:Mitochondrial inner membrane protein OXA1 [Diplonema papillatum]